MEDNSVLGQYRRVAYVDEFYSIIHDVHEKDLLHAGYKKTFDKVSMHGIAVLCNKYGCRYICL